MTFAVAKLTSQAKHLSLFAVHLGEEKRQNYAVFSVDDASRDSVAKINGSDMVTVLGLVVAAGFCQAMGGQGSEPGSAAAWSLVSSSLLAALPTCVEQNMQLCMWDTLKLMYLSADSLHIMF